MTKKGAPCRDSGTLWKCLVKCYNVEIFSLRTARVKYVCLCREAEWISVTKLEIVDLWYLKNEDFPEYFWEALKNTQ